MKYSFEEVKHILYKQAHRIKKFGRNKYEVDELVNEVWLKGSIQKLDHIQYVAARAYWDMIDYIRTIEGRDFMRKGDFFPMPREITNMHALKSNFNSSKGEVFGDFFARIESEKKDNIETISNKDEIENFLLCLSKKKADILKKYFLEQKSLKEIGKEYGVSGSRISIIKKEALRKIRKLYHIEEWEGEKIRFKNNSIKQREPSLEEILPEYIADYEIDNKCALEENLLLEND